MSVSMESTVGQLVTERPNRSRVFQALGIDFCCGGKKPLAQACLEKGLDPQTVRRLLEADLDGPAAVDGKDWSKATLTDLSQHIEQTHHVYLKRELPRLRMMVRKVAAVHGGHSPWLLELQNTFEGFANEMEQHTMKEEQVLFPMIRGLEGGPAAQNGRYAGGLLGPIHVMEAEHEEAGAALEKMRKISNDFVPPMEACNTFRATLAGLEELEAETHRHIHKENSILFPRAAEMEATLQK